MILDNRRKKKSSGSWLVDLLSSPDDDFKKYLKFIKEMVDILDDDEISKNKNDRKV